MKKYNISTLINYTPKSKDLSPYIVDTKEIKDRVMANIKVKDYVKQNITNTHLIKENNSIEVNVEKINSRYGFGKLIAIVCSCLLIVSTTFFLTENQGGISINSNSSSCNTETVYATEIVDSTDTYLFNNYPMPNTANLIAFSNNEEKTYTLTEDNLIELNNSVDCSQWERLEGNPYENIDTSNKSGFTIRYLDNDSNEFIITIYQNSRYITINNDNPNMEHSDYFDTHNDKVYNILQYIVRNLNVGKLQLHDNNIVQKTYDEICYILSGNNDNLNVNVKIDDTKYRDISFYGSNLNTLESKSYIYHKMLNSVDYYNTIEGSFNLTTTDILTHNIQVEYQSDIKNKKAYTHTISKLDGTLEYDAEQYFKTNENGLLSTTFIRLNTGKYFTLYSNDTENGIILPDNERLLKASDSEYKGQVFKIFRNDITHTDAIVNRSIFPQDIAMCYLYDFDNWNITAIDTYLDRDCLIIEGEGNPIQNDVQSFQIYSSYSGNFKLYVDINTGVVLKYELPFSTLNTTSIQIDDTIQIKEFSVEDYPNYSEVEDYSDIYH